MREFRFGVSKAEKVYRIGSGVQIGTELNLCGLNGGVQEYFKGKEVVTYRPQGRRQFVNSSRPAINSAPKPEAVNVTLQNLRALFTFVHIYMCPQPS